jgi:hypothetical protein
MVALSFPEQFAIDRASSVGGEELGPVTGWYDPYDPYGWISPLWMYGSPFWAVGGGEWVVIDGDGSAGPSEEPRGRGRVVDGRGYTQVRPVESGPARRYGGGSTASSSSGGAGGTGSTDSTSTGSSSGSSSGVSSSGYSSGGSGDGARTAVPR